MLYSQRTTLESIEDSIKTIQRKYQVLFEQMITNISIDFTFLFFMNGQLQ